MARRLTQVELAIRDLDEQIAALQLARQHLIDRVSLNKLKHDNAQAAKATTAQ